MQIIFSFLTLHDFPNLASTCRLWSAHVNSMPIPISVNHWNHLDRINFGNIKLFSLPWGPVEDTGVTRLRNQIIAVRNGLRIILPNMNPGPSDFFQYSQRFPNLTELRTFMHPLIFTALDESVAYTVAPKLSFPNLTKLYLVLSFGPEGSASVFANWILDQLPALCPKLQEVLLIDASLRGIKMDLRKLALLPNLTDIDINSTNFMRETEGPITDDTSVFEGSLRQLPLKQLALNLRGIPFRWSPVRMQRLLEAPNQLQLEFLNLENTSITLEHLQAGILPSLALTLKSFTPQQISSECFNNNNFPTFPQAEEVVLGSNHLPHSELPFNHLPYPFFSHTFTSTGIFPCVNNLTLRCFIFTENDLQVMLQHIPLVQRCRFENCRFESLTPFTVYLNGHPCLQKFEIAGCSLTNETLQRVKGWEKLADCTALTCLLIDATSLSMRDGREAEAFFESSSSLRSKTNLVDFAVRILELVSLE